ncbi:hypothetical protein [Aeromicrobium sp.]|uniref:hypothetical protein n=1 Tax=Aeromicrobium sp. TaxID=1871063 RepID=UPI0035163650
MSAERTEPAEPAMGVAGPTLGDLADRAAEAAYVLRPGLADQVEAFLAADSPHRVLLVVGPGGVGKSALTRYVERTASGRGVVRIDGRALAPDPSVLVARLDAAGPSPLVVVDAYELIEPVAGAVLPGAIARLPGDARVVIAGRRIADDTWHREPWTTLALELRLGPLAEAEAVELLTRRGLESDVHAEVIAWAGGLPLALELAARAARVATTTEGAEAMPDTAELDRQLLDLLAGDALQGADRDVLAVASLAPFVDARMLDAVLPAGPGAGAAGEAWLRSLDVAEPVGRGVTLHDRVRTLLAAELRRFEPEYDRLLRLRLVDHLGERVLSSEPHLVADLADLAGVGVGTFVRDAMHRFRLDDVRPRDIEAVRAWFADGPPAHAARFEAWMREAPHHVILVRDGDAPAAVALWATPDQRPPLTEPDAVVEHWCEAAARTRPHDQVVLLTDVVLLADAEHWMKLLAIGNTAMLVRAGLPRLRAAFIGHDARADGEVAGGPAGQVAAFGGVRSADLDIDRDGLQLHGYVIDYGPGGVVGATRDFARAMLEGAGAAGEPPALDVDDVRHALRSARRTAVIARSPLAAGEGGTAERAERARARLRGAIDAAFGAGEDDVVLAAVLRRGHLDDGGGHQVAMRELHMSRSSYFRRLAEATERLASHLLGETSRSDRETLGGISPGER